MVRPRGVVALLLLLVAAPTADAAAGGSVRYAAQTERGTGRLAGRHAPLSVLASATSADAVRLVVQSGSCRGSGCLLTRGTLTGSWRSSRTLPDTGEQVEVKVSGRLSGLGFVRATGTFHGTGFIRQGRCAFALHLIASGGTLTLAGASGLVPGFSAPL
jgi:hypothetical protein